MGYHSPSIIKYLESLTGDLLTAQYTDCIFNEDHFSAIGRRIQVPFRMPGNKLG
jgi:hypothetical protein